MKRGGRTRERDETRARGSNYESESESESLSKRSRRRRTTLSSSASALVGRRLGRNGGGVAGRTLAYPRVLVERKFFKRREYSCSRGPRPILLFLSFLPTLASGAHLGIADQRLNRASAIASRSESPLLHRAYAAGPQKLGEAYVRAGQIPSRKPIPARVYLFAHAS